MALVFRAFTAIPWADCPTTVCLRNRSTLPVVSRRSVPQQSRQHLVRSIPVAGPSSSPMPDPSGAPAGQISSALIDSMKGKISEALETQDVAIQDVYGDGRHVSIDVVSPLFEGKNAVQRQRMVYKAIWLELQDAVHAVDAMTTKTPQEAGR